MPLCTSGAGRCSTKRSRRCASPTFSSPSNRKPPSACSGRRLARSVRLTDVEVGLESEAAVGLRGAAARAVVPHLQETLYEKAVIDLKPFAASAEKKIAEAVADFQNSGDGVRVESKIDNLRLAD